MNKAKPPLQRRLSLKPLQTLVLCGLDFRRLGLGCCCLAGIALRVLAAEALDPAGGVHQLLFAGEEGVARGTDFHVDVALVGRTGHKGVAACAVYAYFVISWMDGCFHRNSLTGCPVLAWFWLGRGSSWWQTFILAEIGQQRQSPRSSAGQPSDDLIRTGRKRFGEARRARTSACGHPGVSARPRDKRMTRQSFPSAATLQTRLAQIQLLLVDRLLQID